MKSYAVIAHRQPLQCIEVQTPGSSGSEVVLETTRCGVCHSDLYFWHGEYNLGGGKILYLKDRGVVLPNAPGHEVVGRVVALGPDAKGVKIGEQRLIYSWIGCGTCARCRAEEDNLCANQRSIGVVASGGFGSHVKVPHPRYLLDFGDLNPSIVSTYACSGLTAYSAIKKLLPLDPARAVVLLGAGGLGLAAVAVLKALGHGKIVSVDVDARKLTAAKTAGAHVTVEAAGANALQAAIKDPVHGVIDFVGSSQSAQNGLALLPKDAKLVLVGVAGGELTLSTTALVMRAQAVVGSLTGTLQELRELLALARQGKLAPTPFTELPASAANDALERLERGDAIGRLVLRWDI